MSYGMIIALKDFFVKLFTCVVGGDILMMSTKEIAMNENEFEFEFEGVTYVSSGDGDIHCASCALQCIGEACLKAPCSGEIIFVEKHP